jgi:hypothetical protein
MNSRRFTASASRASDRNDSTPQDFDPAYDRWVNRDRHRLSRSFAYVRNASKSRRDLGTIQLFLFGAAEYTAFDFHGGC